MKWNKVFFIYLVIEYFIPNCYFLDAKIEICILILLIFLHSYTLCILYFNDRSLYNKISTTIIHFIHLGPMTVLFFLEIKIITKRFTNLIDYWIIFTFLAFFLSYQKKKNVYRGRGGGKRQKYYLIGSILIGRAYFLTC